MSAYGFKTQLKDVLSNAVSYFQDSGDPNAACVKAANEAGFNADQADRLVETFNTARVLCHYKAAEDKTSTCSLADKETVRRQLTPDTAETKAASYESADYGCYKQAEVDYVIPEVKVAGAELKEEPLSKEASDWLAIREASVVADCVKTAEEEARAAYAMADELAEKVAMQMSRNVSLDAIHDRVARLVTAYALDDRYAPGVEKVAAFIPEASDPDAVLLKKYASQHIVDVEDLHDVLPAIKEAADFVAEGAALEAYAAEMKTAQAVPAHEELPDDKDKLENLLLKERILSERGRREATPSTGGGSSGSKSLVSKGLGEMQPLSFVEPLRDLARTVANGDLQSRTEKATEGVNNLRRQLILQDLLVRDKILSQEDPNAVAAAFRSIHQISPDSTLNKEMLRSMLRNVVQSVALSPYDAKTLVDVDKTRRQAYEQKTDVTGGKNNG